MTPDEIELRMTRRRERFAELERLLADPAVYADLARSRELSREHRALERLLELHRRWLRVLDDIEESAAMAAEEEDAELRELAQMEHAQSLETATRLEQDIRVALLPPDPNDGKNIIVEINPAAGGDEAALFAGELARAYLRYAELRHWKVEVLEQSSSDLGGIKNITFSLAGENVYSRMRYESGVHRVQRIPATESGGRIHTSTVTVSVMAEAEEVELNIPQDDLRFDVFRSSGPGGQCVNTTDSAVRVTHIPSGLSVASQQEKSQHRNKEIALRILFARLLEHKQREENAKLAADRKSQVGTGDRSERIRTYNFPQNRITDHRFAVNVFDLPKLMTGEFDLLLDPIVTTVAERQFASAD